MPGLDRSVRDFEPHLALCGGADGYDFYTAILRHWRDILAPGGRMYFEVETRPPRPQRRMFPRQTFMASGSSSPSTTRYDGINR